MQNFDSVRIKIRDIGPGNENLLLTGIIIRKQDSRTVRIKKDNSERSVWSFTLRDSPSDFLNVTVWGSVDYIRNLNENHGVGDVVSLLNAKAIFRKIGDNDDSYQPVVTSSFYASLSEKESEIIPYNGPDLEKYRSLLHLPSKPSGNFLTISDVQRNGNILRGQFINLLAAIQDKGEIRQFQSRDNKTRTCMELQLIDQSYSTLFLTVWGSGLLTQCERWIPKNTVLFLADVRVEWNTFRRIVMLSTTGRTVITEDPLTNAGQSLKTFITSTSFQHTAKFDQLINKYADPSVINEVMSCTGVITKAKDQKQSTEFTALVYAAINSFNIDDSENFIVTKCVRCNSKVDSFLELCLNADCPAGTGEEKLTIDQFYDIRIILVDHTGMLINCKLTNLVAQKMISYNAASFRALPETERTDIKWKYQLKYCAARLVILPLREKLPLISVLSIDTISLGEYSSQIPMC